MDGSQMLVLLLDDQIDRHDELMATFWSAGLTMTATGNPAVAQTILSRTPADILILAERVAGRLTHSLALFAEHRNPNLSTLLISDRTDADTDELYDLIPSVRGILGGMVSPKLVLQLAKCEFGLLGNRPENQVSVMLPKQGQFFSQRAHTLEQSAA